MKSPPLGVRANLSAAVKTGVTFTQLVLEIVALRRSLGRRVAAERLPDLLIALDTAATDAAAIDMTTTRRSLRVAEAFVRRARVWPDTCLYRSLARYSLLRRTGRRVEFVMGVRRVEGSEITGHAWVEIDGQPFGEIRDERLTETFRHTFSYAESPASVIF